MTVAELFAGGGGAALGLHRAGWEHLACVDHDPDACATLAAAGLPALQADLSTPDGRGAVLASLGGRHVDLLWASPPCQPWSTAGKRGGHEDARDGWPWTLAMIDEVRPTWLLAENVPGMLDRRGRPHFEALLVELRSRFAQVGWWLLDSADYAVPQRRRRVFVWAGPAPVAPPPRTHAQPPTHILLGLRPWVTMGEALPHLATGRLVGGGGNPAPSRGRYSRTERDLTDEPSTTIGGPSGNAAPSVEVLVAARRTTGQGHAPRTLDEVAPTLHTSQGGHALLARPSPTVTAQEVRGTRASASSGWTMHGGPDRASDAAWLATGRRRLTPEECAALQAFPADHPWRARTKESLYRLIGNAVPPPLAEAVAQAVRGAAGITTRRLAC